MAPIAAAFIAFFSFCFLVNSSGRNKDVVICAGDPPKSVPNGYVAIIDPPTCIDYPSQHMGTTHIEPVLVKTR